MFKDAIDYLGTYRKSRVKALNNEEVQRWSTSDVSTIQGLLDKFGSTDENTKWKELYDAPQTATVTQRQAVQLKIDFLAGCRRDMRMLFASRAADVRVAVDWDRFEFMKLSYHRQRLEFLDQAIKAKEQA